MAEKFEEKLPGENSDFEEKDKLWLPKEERGHIRSSEEVEEARELIPEEKKMERVEEETGKAEDWYETFSKLGGTRGKERIKEVEEELVREKKTVESAKIPEKGMKTEDVLKGIGVEKPAESFEEVQKRLGERLEKARTRGGEKLSLVDKNEITRDFYLGELGYSVKYRGLLHGKAELLDEKDETIKNEEGKPMEFKTFFDLGRGETPMVDFLRKNLEKKLEKKPIGELTEEEKQEAGVKKAIKETENVQAIREEKISSLKDVKKVGKERLSKLVEGLSYVAALDKLGILGMKKGKDIAVEGGKDLAAIGLSPTAAIEEAGRYIAGRVQVGEAIRKSVIMRGKIRALENIPVDKRPEYYNDLLEAAMREGSGKVSEQLVRGYDKIYKKGKIIRLIEMLGGKLSRPISRTFGPPASPRQERI